MSEDKYIINIIESPQQYIEALPPVLEIFTQRGSNQRRISKSPQRKGKTFPCFINSNNHNKMFSTMDIDKKLTEKILTTKGFDDFYNDPDVKLILKGK